MSARTRIYRSSHWTADRRRRRGQRATCIDVQRIKENVNAVQVTEANAVHPEGFYQKYPKVTWDLGAERWTTVRERSYILIAWCNSCYWHHNEQVLAKPERLAIAEFITGSVHEYECPAKPSKVEFEWWRGPFRTD